MNSIKRHHAIVSFSRDHHFGLLLVWKIRQGLQKSVSAERIGKYVLFFFKEDIETHFKEEEQLLFCRLQADDDLRKQAEEDHQFIRNLMAEIAENENDITLLDKFANALEKHIRFEERELFNHLQNTINPNDLEKIASRFSNDNKAIDDKWQDIFWKKT